MIKRNFLILGLSLIALTAKAQNFELKNVEYGDIKKSPKFEQPFFLMDENGEAVHSWEKTGFASPILYDWNGDGKKDLLVGEFGYQKKESYLLVFENVGKKRKPIYSANPYHAMDINGDKIWIETC